MGKRRKKEVIATENVVQSDSTLFKDKIESPKTFLKKIHNNLIKTQFKNTKQEEFSNLIREKEIILCQGAAGTGKSYLSVVMALLLLSEGKYDQIVIVTPAVEADEKLGSLPGDVEEKLSPYTFSTLYLFDKLIKENYRRKLEENKYLKIMALAYMRGINIDNSIVIFEEAQNSTIGQMKTFLTRIGENSKFIISGDVSQIDRHNVKENGLSYAMNKLKNIDEIGKFEFGICDIVRNPLINKILSNWE